MDPEEGEDFDDIQDFDETEDQDDDQSQADQDDGDDQGQQADDQDGDEEPPRRPSRAQARIEELDRRSREFERIAQEAAQRAEAAERRLNEMLNGNSRAEAERRERERLANMDPEERAAYQARQSEERTTREIATLRHQIADSTDRSEFAAACATNPALAKVKDQVEAELRKLRAAGTDVPRHTLAAYLIGQQVLEKAPKARARAEKRAAANLDRERARPTGGASDAPARGRVNDDKAARDKRLENFTF
jgi:hypothetical protein